MTGGETLAVVSVPVHCIFRRVAFHLVQELWFILALMRRRFLEAAKAMGSLERPSWLWDGAWLYMEASRCAEPCHSFARPSD